MLPVLLSVYCLIFARTAFAASTTVLTFPAMALGSLATVPAADGAFYCLLRVNTTLDPMAVAERLIREHKVAVIPGFAFGMKEGCYFRVAYGALQKATVSEGVGRLVGGLRQICEI